MMNKNWQLKCVKAFYDITGELDEYKEKELSTFGNNMYMLFMSGIILGFLLSFMFTTDCVGVITFLVFCYSLYQQEQVIHRLELDIYEVSEDEVGEAKKKMLKRTFLQTLIVMGLAIFVAIGLWRTGLLQENKISFEMYFTFIFPLVIGLITMISFLSNFIANRRKIKVIRE